MTLGLLCKYFQLKRSSNADLKIGTENSRNPAWVSPQDSHLDSRSVLANYVHARSRIIVFKRLSRSISIRLHFHPAHTWAKVDERWPNIDSTGTRCHGYTVGCFASLFLITFDPSHSIERRTSRYQ